MTDGKKLAITFAVLVCGIVACWFWTMDHLEHLPPDTKPVTEVWDPISGAVIWTATEDAHNAD